MDNNNETLNRIYDKVEKLDEKFDTKIDLLHNQFNVLDKHLSVYNIELQKHIEGVQLARKENKLLKDYIENKTEQIEKDIDPIKKHVYLIQNGLSFMGKILGGLTLLGGVLVILKELGLLKL